MILVDLKKIKKNAKIALVAMLVDVYVTKIVKSMLIPINQSNKHIYLDIILKEKKATLLLTFYVLIKEELARRIKV